MTQTLLLIALALALMIGSFIWFVATWDASKEEPLTWRAAPLFILAEKRPPEGPLATGTTYLAQATATQRPYQTHIKTISNPYGVL